MKSSIESSPFCLNPNHWTIRKFEILRIIRKSSKDVGRNSLSCLQWTRFIWVRCYKLRKNEKWNCWECPFNPLRTTVLCPVFCCCLVEIIFFILYSNCFFLYDFSLFHQYSTFILIIVVISILFWCSLWAHTLQTYVKYVYRDTRTYTQMSARLYMQTSSIHPSFIGLRTSLLSMCFKNSITNFCFRIIQNQQKIYKNIRVNHNTPNRTSFCLLCLSYCKHFSLSLSQYSICQSYSIQKVSE